MAQKIRLQKYLSDAGVASRRKAEELLLEGRILINDRIVEESPAFVDPENDRVIVDGRVVKPQPHDYFIVNKPKNVVCSNRDPGGRPRAIDLLPPLRARLFVVGRLDTDSTGLLLMTNDGELAQRVTHPKFGVPKVYRVEVRGHVDSDLPAKMKKGVYLSEGKASAEHVEITHAGRERSVLEITLAEGRNRQIRRMLSRFGHPVKSLKRLSIGPLTVKRLPVGGARRLSARELAALRDAIGDGKPQRTRRKRKPASQSTSTPTKKSATRTKKTAKAAKPAKSVKKSKVTKKTTNTKKTTKPKRPNKSRQPRTEPPHTPPTGRRIIS